MTRPTRLAALALLTTVAVAACGGSASVPPATAAPPAPATNAPTTDAPAATPAETPPAETAAPATPGAAVDPTVVDAIDACALLTAAEVAAAFGVPVDQVQPMAGSTALPGSRTCFYRPPGTADGPQVNVAVLAVPDYSRPAEPSPAPGLDGASGAWWIDTLTGDLKLEATAPNGVRLTLAHQDTAAGAPPTDAALAFLVPLMQTALGRLP